MIDYVYTCLCGFQSRWLVEGEVVGGGDALGHPDLGAVPAGR